MRREDIAVGLVLALGFGAALWEAASFQYSSEFAPGPGFAPVWMSAIGLVLSLLVVVGGWRAASSTSGAGTQKSQRIDRAGSMRVGATVAGLVAMLVLVPHIGFGTAVLLFLLFLTLAVQRLRPLVGIPASLITVALVYFVFVRLLGVPIPVGPLGF